MKGNAILYLYFLCLLAVLIWFYGRVWPKTVVASARQHLFELRDRLFNLALDGRIEFSSPIYRELREHLNRSLRFTHKLTFLTFVIASKRSTESVQEEASLPKQIDQLEDVALRNELQTIYNRMAFVLLEQMLKRSPFFVVLLIGYLVFSMSRTLSERLRETKSRLLALLSSETAGRAFN